MCVNTLTVEEIPGDHADGVYGNQHVEARVLVSKPTAKICSLMRYLLRHCPG